MGGNGENLWFELMTPMLRVERSIPSQLYTKNLYENRTCNQWDKWRAYGHELLL